MDGKLIYKYRSFMMDFVSKASGKSANVCRPVGGWSPPSDRSAMDPVGSRRLLLLPLSLLGLLSAVLGGAQYSGGYDVADIDQDMLNVRLGV